jgi:hypothetical protein
LGKLNNKITVNEDQLFWMFRYCLSRRTYAASDGADAIIANWEFLSKNTKDMIVKEVNQAMYRNECDQETWRKVILIDLDERVEQERNSHE